MLFQYLDLITVNPGLALRLILATTIALLVAITVHEASHAFIAYRQGDRTAKALGRLTLNPVRHLDPAGTLFMLFVGFGWGKPVPVNPYRLRSGPRVGGALVALAGPTSNLVIAAVLSLPARLDVLPWHGPRSGAPFLQQTPVSVLSDLIGIIIFFNIILAVFNLLPIAPLDGFKVALGVLPGQAAFSFARLEPYGPGILMALIGLSFFTDFSLWTVLGPLVRFVSIAVVGRPV